MGRPITLCFLACCILSMGTRAEPGQDLEQEPIVIKGEQDGPGTLYIVPWKQVGEPLAADPLQPRFDLDARPLDRETFINELELQREGAAGGISVSPDSSTPEELEFTGKHQ